MRTAILAVALVACGPSQSTDAPPIASVPYHAPRVIPCELVSPHTQGLIWCPTHSARCMFVTVGPAPERKLGTPIGCSCDAGGALCTAAVRGGSL